VTGNLKDWGVTERLGELVLSALVTSGRYNEMSEAVDEPARTLPPRKPTYETAVRAPWATTEMLKNASGAGCGQVSRHPCRCSG